MVFAPAYIATVRTENDDEPPPTFTDDAKSPTAALYTGPAEDGPPTYEEATLMQNMWTRAQSLRLIVIS